MRTLISLLIKHYFFIIFLVLEIISFVFIYQTSYYQRYTIISSANSITGNFNRAYTNLTEYFRLKQENERLADENAFLRSLYMTDTVSLIQNELVKPDTAFRYIPAKVISNSTNKRSNYFMINKGSSDGIMLDMGVVSMDGVAGIIVATSRNFSTAMSFLHKDARVSARIRKNNQLVSTSWSGKNYREGLVSDIPTHITLNMGDTIVTSGNSLIFPEGLHVGYVQKYMPDTDKLFNEATFEPATDFKSLYWVYVIENLNRPELIELKEQTDE
jgi:rod shape-determining protein MreC